MTQLIQSLLECLAQLPESVQKCLAKHFLKEGEDAEAQIEKPPRQRRAGLRKGTKVIADDVDEPLPAAFWLAEVGGCSAIPLHPQRPRCATGIARGAAPAGVTCDSVKRPAGIRVPRARQVPDSRKAGGHQPTDIRWINRGLLPAPALVRPAGQKLDADFK